MNKKLIFTFFVLALFSFSVGADGDDDDDDDHESIMGIEMEGLGEFAQFLLIFTLSIVIWKPLFMWLRKNGPDLFKKEPRPFKKTLGVINRRYMKIHLWAGFFAALLGTIHGYFLEWHWTLWAGTAAMWILVISGGLLQWKWPPKEFRRGARILHMQRTLSVLLVILLVVGHNIVD